MRVRCGGHTLGLRVGAQRASGAYKHHIRWQGWTIAHHWSTPDPPGGAAQATFLWQRAGKGSTRR